MSAAGSATWDEAAIRERVRELDESVGWYQDVDLGRGIHTKSRVLWGEPIDHPRHRWRAVERALPDDLRGLSVLDVGCNAGFFAFEAKRRGAERVCGVDLKPGYVEQARFCADVLGLDVDFRCLSVYDLQQLEARFDLVLCVGLLYHCEHLALAVERVAAVAASKLVVETQVHRGHRRTPFVRYTGDSKLPGIWYPNLAALEALLRRHGFTRFTVLHREGSFLNRREGRAAILAER